MALQSSGTITHANIQTEFGGSNPISLSEYYRGGGLVPNITANNTIPTTGTISESNFYSTLNRIQPTITIAANTTNYVLNTAKVSGYMSGLTDVTLIISSGIYVSASSTSNYALTIDTSWAAGDTVTIINNGYILGCGGAGGTGAGLITGYNPGDNYTSAGWYVERIQSDTTAPSGSAGAAGGPAMLVQRTTYFTNNGIIGGGGGGGGGGSAYRRNTSPADSETGSGGGGGRSNPAANSAAGARGTWSPTNPTAGAHIYGNTGAAGTVNGAGAGGAQVYSPYIGYNGAGGAGGGWGAAGASGSYAPYPYDRTLPFAGGAGGKAVVGNANIVGGITGTVYGVIQ